MPCPCSNPDCALPPGRCFLCGVPTLHEKTSGTEVCTTCVDAVGAVYAAELNPSTNTTPGWFLDTTDDEPSIVADDDMNRFESDEAAAEHVRAVVTGASPAEPWAERRSGPGPVARPHGGPDPPR